MPKSVSIIRKALYVFIVCACLALCAALCACAGRDVHETFTGRQTESVTADVTESGSETGETACDHDYALFEEQDATCEHYGYRTVICTLCNHKETVTLEKTAHNYREVDDLEWGHRNLCVICGDFVPLP